MEAMATNGAFPWSNEDSMEFQLLMAYTQKRRPTPRMVPQGPASYDSPQSAQASGKKRKKSTGAGVLNEVTDKLTKIVDSVHLDSGDIEADGPDDVVQKIVELLRESGDRLNEEMKTNETLANFFHGRFNYSLFEKVTSLFLQKVDPSDIPSSKTPEQAKIALTFEVTNRLTAVDYHPMNMVMGFGAKYLQDNFSSWVKNHGGWEKAFDAEDDDEVQ